jgi:hypothetical protein
MKRYTVLELQRCCNQWQINRRASEQALEADSPVSSLYLTCVGELHKRIVP